MAPLQLHAEVGTSGVRVPLEAVLQKSVLRQVSSRGVLGTFLGLY